MRAWPTVILRTNRQQYYRALRVSEADAGRFDPLVNFVGRAMERSLSLNLEACTPRLSQPAENAAWMPLRKAAEGTPYSQEYPSLLARLRRIEALKRGKVWYDADDHFQTKAKNPFHIMTTLQVE